MFQSSDYLHFYNDTDLPVIIDGWTQTSVGLSSLKSIKINPKTSQVIHSITGEWYMNSMFYNKEDKLNWKGLEKYLIIGKFRSSPCAMGNYAWMEYNDDKFKCVYSEIEITEENKIKGKITFSMN